MYRHAVSIYIYIYVCVCVCACVCVCIFLVHSVFSNQAYWIIPALPLFVSAMVRKDPSGLVCHPRGRADHQRRARGADSLCVAGRASGSILAGTSPEGHGGLRKAIEVWGTVRATIASFACWRNRGILK